MHRDPDYVKGEQLYKEKKFELALQSFSKSASKGNIMAIGREGAAYVHLKKYYSAIRKFEEEIFISSDYYKKNMNIIKKHIDSYYALGIYPILLLIKKNLLSFLDENNAIVVYINGIIEMKVHLNLNEAKNYFQRIKKITENSFLEIVKKEIEDAKIMANYYLCEKEKENQIKGIKLLLQLGDENSLKKCEEKLNLFSKNLSDKTYIHLYILCYYLQKREEEFKQLLYNSKDEIYTQANIDVLYTLAKCFFYVNDINNGRNFLVKASDTIEKNFDYIEKIADLAFVNNAYRLAMRFYVKFILLTSKISPIIEWKKRKCIDPAIEELKEEKLQIKKKKETLFNLLNKEKYIEIVTDQSLIENLTEAPEKFLHPRLLQYIQYKQPNVYMEKFHGGTLYDYIHKTFKGANIKTEIKISIIKQIAEGLEFLKSKSFRPFEFNSHKICLVNKIDDISKVPEIKIFSFISSKVISKNENWFHYSLFHNIDNEESKYYYLYSFGVLIWELLTGDVPFEEIVKQDKANCSYFLKSSLLSMKKIPDDTPNELLKMFFSLINSENYLNDPGQFEGYILNNLVNFNLSSINTSIEEDEYCQIKKNKYSISRDDFIRIVEELFKVREEGESTLLKYFGAGASGTNPFEWYIFTEKTENSLQKSIQMIQEKGEDYVFHLIEQIIEGFCLIENKGLYISGYCLDYIYFKNNIDDEPQIRIANYGKEKEFVDKNFPFEHHVSNKIDFANMFCLILLKDFTNYKNNADDIKTEYLEKNLNYQSNDETFNIKIINVINILKEECPTIERIKELFNKTS